MVQPATVSAVAGFTPLFRRRQSGRDRIRLVCASGSSNSVRSQRHRWTRTHDGGFANGCHHRNSPGKTKILSRALHVAQQLKQTWRNSPRPGHRSPTPFAGPCSP